MNFNRRGFIASIFGALVFPPKISWPTGSQPEHWAGDVLISTNREFEQYLEAFSLGLMLVFEDGLAEERGYREFLASETQPFL